MKKVFAFVIATVMLCGICVSAHPFTDVGGHWAEEQLEIAYDNGMINGDPDGRFRPDDEITRAEFLKMLASIICKRDESYISEAYGDGSHWASKYYNYAILNMYRPLDADSAVDGIIPGKMSAADFDKPIGRWEMAYLVSSAMRNVCGVEGEPAERTFADADFVKSNYSLIIAENISNTYNLGVMTGDENGKINAQLGGTRAEAVVIMNRVDNIMLEIIRVYEQAEAAAKEHEDAEKSGSEEPAIP